jgi:hypothetical protein
MLWSSALNDPGLGKDMETTMTITVDSQTQISTNLISRSRAVLSDSGLGAIAVFSTLSLLATIYFAIHSPAAASLFVNFPD